MTSFSSTAMPYPPHVAVPSVSLTHFHTEFDSSDLTNSLSAASTAEIGLKRPTTATSNVSSINMRSHRGGLGKVFGGISKMFGRPHIVKGPVRATGGVGYVMPRERKNMLPSVLRELNQIPGRGILGTDRPPMRSRGLDPTRGRVRKTKVVSRKFADELLLPDMPVSNPSSGGGLTLHRLPSFEKGDDVMLPRGPGGSSNLYVVNPDDAVSIASTTDLDIVMSGGLGATDAAPESYEAFKARFQAREQQVSDAPPRLQYIPRLAPLDFDADMCLMPAPLSPTLGPAAIQRNRDAALRQLESGPSDHPAALKPQPHPAALLPGPRYRDQNGVERVRPATWRNSLPGDKDRVYSPTDFGHYGRTSRHAWRPLERRPASKDVARASKPTGVTKSKSVRKTAPATNIARKTIPYRAWQPDSIPTPVTRKPVASTPVPATNKPLPAMPASASPQPKSPARHKMNDNGYPIANLSSAEARYSATPSYQRRTVDGVEAKYKKFAANSVETKEAKYKKTMANVAEMEDKKTAAKLTKANKAAEKEAKKAAKEQKKQQKYEQRPDLVRKQAEIEATVRSFLGV